MENAFKLTWHRKIKKQQQQQQPAQQPKILIQNYTSAPT